MRSNLALTAALLFGLAAPAAAQPARYNVFGQACNNLLSWPVFIPEGTPVLGNAMRINLTSSWPAVPALGLAPGLSFLITGTSTTSWAGLQLPAQLNIPGFAPSCGLLQTSINFVDPVAQRPTPQTAPIFFFIPNIPSLLGIHYWQQGIVFSSDPSGPLVMLSRAGHGVIGT